MSVVASDLVRYGSANRPNDDASTTGGAIDTADTPEVAKMSTADTVEVLSDGADTRDVTITGRDASGAIVTETETLSGSTPQETATTFERVLKVELSASDGSRTVTVREATTTSNTIATLGPNLTSATAHFRRAESQSSAVERYEKDFWKNENGSAALDSAEVTLTADPASKIKIALAGSKDDSGSETNRLTKPSLTFSDDSVALSVPTGSLGAGEAIGVWIEQALAADDSPVHNTFTLELAGATV